MTKHRMNSNISRAQGSNLQIIRANEDVPPPNAKMLEKAIIEVGSAELDRLSAPLDDKTAANNIECALRVLQHLSCVQPTYTEWISLWYLLWYQASQANIAAGMMRNLIDYRIYYHIKRCEPRNLCIIDVGSGALNGVLGFSDVTNSYPFRFVDFLSISYVGIDPSDEMNSLGLQLLDQLGDLRGKTPPRPKAIGESWKFNFLHMKEFDLGRIASMNVGKTEYWICAFNSLQPGQSRQVQQTLATVSREFTPTIDMFSSSSKANQQLNRAIPLSTTDYHYSELDNDDLTATELKGVLPKLTEFRQQVYNKYRLKFKDERFASNYLNNPPNWIPRKSRGIICLSNRVKWRR